MMQMPRQLESQVAATSCWLQFSPPKRFTKILCDVRQASLALNPDLPNPLAYGFVGRILSK